MKPHLHLLKKTNLAALAIVALASVASQAQTVQNVRVNANATTAEGKRIQITYDLKAKHGNIPCFVRVKYGTKVRNLILTEVKGDVGQLVYPGKNKQIYWDFVEELVHSVGEKETTIQVEAWPQVQVLKKVKRKANVVVGIDTIYKKGKAYQMKLYRHEKEVVSLDSMDIKSNSFSLKLPKKVRARQDYQIGIADGDKVFYSNAFKIKPVVGRFWKILPFLAVPIYIIGSQTLEDLQDLPGAPEPN